MFGLPPAGVVSAQGASLGPVEQRKPGEVFQRARLAELLQQRRRRDTARVRAKNTRWMTIPVDGSGASSIANTMS